ncbi:N6-adenosine-methyltransferase non-catalytic subunit MTB isoform X2 [Elaeis guineensis]|uniref:LOW QUALITY PROTEIN: N6-adenosine-methyltransferase non-catalytic subunit MTB n=1 Tax=Elaeis guineensis var. tenera TaxID=51953 RepID=A0A6I9SJ77_ELAGV|nr:LOW QUALITY PROTEIN: N6-adenosine-methyltransferase non-catalytic subunit MTB [Elaeis guineensis]
MDVRYSKTEENEDREGTDERKHRSSKSQKHSSVKEAQKRDSGRRRSSGDRKKSSSSSSGDGSEYDRKRESHTKIPRKNPDERSEKRSSEGYQEIESASIRRSRYEENERHSSRKSSMKPSESSYVGKSDSKGGKAVDHSKHGFARDGKQDHGNESSDSKCNVVDSSAGKGFRSSSTREEKTEDGETCKSRGRMVGQDEDSMSVTAPYEARPDVHEDDKWRRVFERSPEAEGNENDHRYSISKPHEQKSENYRQHQDSAYGSRDEVQIQERSISRDEEMRDRIGREVRYTKRSRTPERSGRHRKEEDDHDRGNSESDNEKNIGLKGREWERKGYKDDRSSKGKDRSWNDENGDREASKDHWKRNQTRQDSKDRESDSGHVKEWDLQWCEQEMVDGENLHGKPGYRKNARIRPDGVKASSASRNAYESSDSIEIKPNKNLDFGKEESSSIHFGRRSELGSQQDFTSGVNDGMGEYPPEKKGKIAYGYGDELQVTYQDHGSPMDQMSTRNSLDSHAKEGREQGDTNYDHTGLSQSNDSQHPFGNIQGSGSVNRPPQQGLKGGRPVRGGRGRLTGRDAQWDAIPSPMMGPSFGPLSLPPGPMQSFGPNMSHLPGPPIPPGVFFPPFPGPLIWPGARGVDMNMLAVRPSISPIHPPGPVGPRFAPNMGTGPNHGMYFNQPGLGRGIPSNMSGSGLNAMGVGGHGMPHDKAPSSWGPQRNSGPSKGPSRGEQNDYSQNFVDTGMRPQNFIRELELTSVVEDYPKLRELIQKKDEIVAKSASPPMYYKCDLREHVLSPEFFGTKFDVILVDPPWEEYVHRAPGVTDHMEYWKFEEIMNLMIEAIADTPSFIFLWVGDGVGLEQGRQCLKKWGFRRCEDICWVKTNKTNATPALRHDSHTLCQHSKEHCLMGIKGTVRRSTDGHIIHANIDTDVMIAEEPAYGSTKKPDDLYRIIEHFSLGRRRLELFGEDHNIRSGWLTVGKGLSSSNFNSEAYIRNFAGKDGNVWQGGGGRNPPPDAPHLVQTTPDIESLRPKSPPPKSQQLQPIPLMSGSNSNNRRCMGNSPQKSTPVPFSGFYQDVLGPDPANALPWTPSQVGASKGPDGGYGRPDNGKFEGFRFDACVQASGDYHEFESH